VLVADDQPDVLAAVRLLLKLNGFAVETASSPAAVLAALLAWERRALRPPGDGPQLCPRHDLGHEGMELADRVRALAPALPIVVMTAWSTVPLAVALMRNGVADFVEKPFDNARLLAAVRAQVTEGRKRRRDSRLEDDAREVQRRLLSRPLPAAPGYAVGAAWRFAERLGGDAYEVAVLPKTAWRWPSPTSAARGRRRRCSWPARTPPCATSWPRPWPRARSAAGSIGPCLPAWPPTVSSPSRTRSSIARAAR
jgi:FixJ family two-component response regulator